MSKIPGSVPIGGFIAPTDSTDVYATHDDLYGRGGYKIVDDLTARDAIPSGRRKEGAPVYVKSERKEYRLVGGLTNSDWLENQEGGVVDNNFITLSESGNTNEQPRWDEHATHFGTDLFNLSILPGGYRNVYGDFTTSISGIANTKNRFINFWCLDPAGKPYKKFDYSLGTIGTGYSSFGREGCYIRLVRDYDELTDGVLNDGDFIFDDYTDIDGNVYSAVKIGTQVWINSNLRVTKYNDGTAMTLNESLPTYMGTWYNNGDDTIYYCRYNLDQSVADIYGLIYNFWAVKGGVSGTYNIVNSGSEYRVSSSTDWNTLVSYITTNYEGVTTSNVANTLKSIRQVNSTYEKPNQLGLKKFPILKVGKVLTSNKIPTDPNELASKYFVENFRQNIFTKQFIIEPYEIIWDKDFIKIVIADLTTDEGKEFQRRSIVLSSVAVETGSGRVFINHKLRKTTIENNNYNPGITSWVVNTVQPAMPFIGFYIKDLGNTLTPENDIGRIYISILQSEDEPSIFEQSHGVALSPYVDIDGETSYWDRSNVIVDDKTTNAAHSGWMKTTFEWFYQTLNTDVFPGTVYKTVDDTTLTTAPYLNNEKGGVLKRAYYPVYARSKSADMILEAYQEMDNPDLYSNPDILNLYCHWSNSHVQTNRTFGVNILWIGAGDLEDADASWATSYGDGMEFIEPTERDDIGSAGGVNWNDVHQQSPAVAIVGAKMKYIKNQTGAGWNTIRLACRETATQSTANIAAGIKWDKYRGFGVINVADAITYIENLKTSFKTGLTERYNESKGYCSFMDVEDFTDNTPLPKRLTAQAPKGNYADNAAALTAGLSVGDYYHTDGIIKIVIPAT